MKAIKWVKAKWSVMEKRDRWLVIAIIAGVLFVCILATFRG